MRLREIFEQFNEDSTNTVGIIFGRFNPPHKGHKAAWEMAAKNDSWYVGTNKSTQGPKDPLPFEVKVAAMETIWPEVSDHIVAETSWLTLASKVYEEHGDVTLVCYTDEDWVTKTIVQYNGKESAHGFYNFPDIKQQPTPRLSSATALRAAVQSGDRDAFADAAGVPADTKVAGKPFFDLVAEYLLPYANAPKKTSKKKEPAVEEGMFGLSTKEKAAIMNVTAKISDIPGNWDHKNQTYTERGLQDLKNVMKNEKYLKYALSLTSKDYEESLDEENPNQQLSRYKSNGPTYRGEPMPSLGDDPVDNAVRYKPNKTDSYEQNFGREEIKRLIKPHFKELSEVHQKFLYLRFWKDMTLSEIAEEFNVSPERARQIESSSIRKLKDKLFKNKINPDTVDMNESVQGMCKVCGQTPCNCTYIYEDQELTEMAYDSMMHPKYGKVYWMNHGGAHIIAYIGDNKSLKILSMGTHEQIAKKWKAVKDKLNASGMFAKTEDSNVMKSIAKSLENPPKIMQHRAKRDIERQRQYDDSQKRRPEKGDKDEWGDYKKEDAAGVGIITKQNTTKDVGPGTLRKNLKAFKLV
jgi:RNA polymerase sigma factor (sigma-70 family)